MSSPSPVPGYLPTPLTSSSQATQTPSSNQVLGGSNNFIYIYSFISTLFILLCIALLVLLRALIRRRRLDAAFNLANAETDPQQQQPSRRRKKRKLGNKPLLLDAWIGKGPLPTSLSSEDLLKFTQPFSAARKPTEEAQAPIVGEKNPAVIVEEPEPDPERMSKPRLLHLLSTSQVKSTSSCTEEMATPPSAPLPTPELEQLQIGFLIAMPQPKSRPPIRRLASASTISVLKGEDEWPFTDSRWSDHLLEGELPELTVGVSTISIPVQTLDGQYGHHGHTRNGLVVSSTGR